MVHHSTVNRAIGGEPVNERMRRLLDEDQDDGPPTVVEAIPRRTAKQPVHDRRQLEKERGKSIAKFLKERKTATNEPPKP